MQSVNDALAVADLLLPIGTVVAIVGAALYIGRKEGQMDTRLSQVEEDVEHNKVRIGQRVTRDEFNKIESRIADLHVDVREIRALIVANGKQA